MAKRTTHEEWISEAERLIKKSQREGLDLDELLRAYGFAAMAADRAYQARDQGVTARASQAQQTIRRDVHAMCGYELPERNPGKKKRAKAKKKNPDARAVLRRAMRGT